MPFRNPPSGESILELLDAAYDLCSSERDWLQHVGRAANKIMGAGGGVHLFLTDYSPSSSTPLADPILVGGNDEWAERWENDWWGPFMAQLDVITLTKMYGFGACSYWSDFTAAAANKVPTLANYLDLVNSESGFKYVHRKRATEKSLPYEESLNLVCMDASLRGCALVIPHVEEKANSLTELQISFLERLAAHIAAAHRLRRTQQKPIEIKLDHAVALFEENGNLAHTQSSSPHSINALQDAAHQFARARNNSSSGEEKLHLWQALIDGRWSIQSQTDTDGHRYIVARPNLVKAPPRASLSKSEERVATCASLGHSNKMIAYELGVSLSTVSSQLTAARRKLGAKTRTELIHTIRSKLSSPPDAAPPEATAPPRA